MKTTTIKVSKDTLKLLEHLKETMNEKSIEGVIRRLIKMRRLAILEEAYGLDRDLIGEFSEEDRLEGRY